MIKQIYLIPFGYGIPEGRRRSMALGYELEGGPR